MSLEAVLCALIEVLKGLIKNLLVNLGRLSECVTGDGKF